MYKNRAQGVDQEPEASMCKVEPRFNPQKGRKIRRRRKRRRRTKRGGGRGIENNIHLCINISYI